jgi:ssDNA-binding replication factor A large subunit
LIDQQGTQIQATFFNDQADKYDDFLKENCVYLFSNGTIKIANQKYTSIKNDYCIVFDRNSEIKECEDDEHISGQGFSFTTIDEINDFEQMRTVDAIGVVTAI